MRKLGCAAQKRGFACAVILLRQASQSPHTLLAKYSGLYFFVELKSSTVFCLPFCGGYFSLLRRSDRRLFAHNFPPVIVFFYP